ncbi:hypothetical protein [Spiroplasma poulsonii]|uniref:hypothetical protein n=1 Tax=Spiroplasma poulsonii TaxID=2138 RepID=UPI001F4C5E0F|nr:hypothetical protein [Spiroplasma poulsonii]UNF61879.1 hypothetical protein MNU24_08175 [Spiroplasma poulsonii]
MKLIDLSKHKKIKNKIVLKIFIKRRYKIKRGVIKWSCYRQKKLKEYDIDSYYLNLASTITNRKNVTVQKHNEILEKRICEDNANFLNPRDLEISIYNPLTNQQLDTKLINNFLKMQDFTNKNWYNEYKINKNGKGAYFIFANNSKLNFITIDFTMIIWWIR